MTDHEIYTKETLCPMPTQIVIAWSDAAEENSRNHPPDVKVIQGNNSITHFIWREWNQTNKQEERNITIIFDVAKKISNALYNFGQLVFFGRGVPRHTGRSPPWNLINADRYFIFLDSCWIYNMFSFFAFGLVGIQFNSIDIYYSIQIGSEI